MQPIFFKVLRWYDDIEKKCYIVINFSFIASIDTV
jgi:hypothetical protein